MASVQGSKEEMLKRGARFKDRVPNRKAYVDSSLPGHARENFKIIGRGVAEDPADMPAIADPHDFNVSAVRAKPGNGAALHSHATVEVFIPLSGQWAIYWGDAGEDEVVLGSGDTISVPPGVMRGFRNAGDEEACLLAIIGGRDPGHVSWSPEVLERAGHIGVGLDDQGNLVRG